MSAEKKVPKLLLPNPLKGIKGEISLFENSVTKSQMEITMQTPEELVLCLPMLKFISM